MTRLILFDIDGTLCQTVAVDALCIERALTEALGVDVPTIEPFNGDNGTDTGVTIEAYRAIRGLSPTPEEIETVRRAFMRQLLDEHDGHPAEFVEISGARSAFSRIAGNHRCAVGFASGAWKDSALFKLSVIGIDGSEFPGAFSEDSPNRVDIIRAAIERASLQYHMPSWEHIIYIGDGVWDVRAARALNIGFIGIGVGDRMQALRTEGATVVLDDFTEYNVLLDAIEATCDLGGGSV